MSRVLVVDDEQDYRDELELGLSRKGHEVRTAPSARDAIRLGVGYRPDVLVADWMLKASVHGLHVCEVLRAVAPDLQTILITGFASRDLESKAGECGVFRFLEKPFTLQEIHTAVCEASAAETPRRSGFLPAVVAVNGSDTITYANPKAMELFAEIGPGPARTSLIDLFTTDTGPNLDLSTEQWVEISPRAEQRIVWHVRANELPDGSRVFVILQGDETSRSRNHPVIRMLLEISEPVRTWWPFEERALIIDRDEQFRRRVFTAFEQAGCICHAAEDHEQALRLFERDSGIHFVLLDYDTAGGSLDRVVRQLEDVRGEAIIVGICKQDRCEEFAAAGVKRCLTKPWRIEDLINLLTGRIGECVDCGLPIPLRRPQPGEAAGSWVCAGCGSRYCAVLDDDFPPDVIANVMPGERFKACFG